MTLLIPAFLWLLIPIALLFYYKSREFVDTVHLFILALIVVALARPVWHQAPQETEIEAREIIIALDISYSMRATDIQPNRYEYAKESINTLLKNNITDNITLMAFTTNPLLLSPPTTDHALVSIALESLNPQYILTKGTSLENLFTKLSSLGYSDAHLILITDGGEERDVEKLNTILAETHLSLTILALGTTRGTTIKKSDGKLLKDESGNLVISRINPLLKQLATSNNATYLLATNSAIDTAQELEQNIENQHQKSKTINKKSQNYNELYGIPLVIALLLFLTIHTRAIKYLFILLAFFGVEAQASFWDTLRLSQAYSAYNSNDFNLSQKYLLNIHEPSLESQVALASSYYKAQRYQKALSIYQSIRTTAPKTKQMLYYNIGNCYSKLKSYKKAKKSYIKALQLGDDADSSYNLSRIILLEEQSSLSFAKPQAEGGESTQSDSEESSEKSSDSNQNSGSGGGKQKSKSDKEKSKKTLLESSPSSKHPTSSKLYELINKGYIYEKEPW